MLLQELPRAAECQQYHWRSFRTSDPGPGARWATPVGAEDSSGEEPEIDSVGTPEARRRARLLPAAADTTVPQDLEGQQRPEELGDHAVTPTGTPPEGDTHGLPPP